MRRSVAGWQRSIMDDARRAHTDRVIAAALRDRQSRDAGYREQALKLFPWICGRCGREFTRDNLRQLTVHHKDDNHDNNPADGSNWELLCLYCHDNEHARELDAEAARAAGVDDRQALHDRATARPFSSLMDLLGQGKHKSAGSED